MRVLYFHGRNLVFKRLLDLQLHNKTIIGFGFGIIAKLILKDNSPYHAQSHPIICLSDNTLGSKLARGL